MLLECLDYPIDSATIMKKRRSLKRQLIASNHPTLSINIAILGGSTTHDIKQILELFLLNNGIKPSFYESEYGQYWQDAMFENSELNTFKPDIIYIHTSNCNLLNYPSINNSEQEICDMMNEDFMRFESMWDALIKKYQCPIIQNNFEMPKYRLLGNKDASDCHGRINYITRLNTMFYEFAQKNDSFFINDIK